MLLEWVKLAFQLLGITRKIFCIAYVVRIIYYHIFTKFRSSSMIIIYRIINSFVALKNFNWKVLENPFTSDCGSKLIKNYHTFNLFQERHGSASLNLLQQNQTHFQPLCESICASVSYLNFLGKKNDRSSIFSSSSYFSVIF